MLVMAEDAGCDDDCGDGGGNADNDADGHPVSSGTGSSSCLPETLEGN